MKSIYVGYLLTTNQSVIIRDEWSPQGGEILFEHTICLASSPPKMVKNDKFVITFCKHVFFSDQGLISERS